MSLENARRKKMLVLAWLLTALGCHGGGHAAGSGAGSTVAGIAVAQTVGSFVSVTPLAEARVFHTATLLQNGTVLVVGGQNGAQTVSSTSEIFDPATGRTRPGPLLNTARMHHAAVLLPTGRVLVAGGQSNVQGLDALASIEVYDPVLGTWTLGAPLREARSGPAAALANGAAGPDVMIAGGASFQGGTWVSSRTAEVYNVSAGTVVSLPAAMAQPRFDARAIALSNGAALVQGGYAALSPSGVPAPSCEVFSGATSLFAPVGTIANRAENALVDRNGSIFALGGTDGVSLLASVEEWNGQTWLPAAPLATARRGASASSVWPGILVAGGFGAGGALASCELVPGATNGLAPSLGVARGYHTATTLSTGAVVVAGGTDGQSILSSIEVWSPTGVAVAGAMPPSGVRVPGGSITSVLPQPLAASSVGVTGLMPSSGGPGCSLVITGIGFDPNAANDIVTVDGTLATVLSVNLANPLAETLTVTVPAAALTGPVVVSVNGVSSPQNPVFTVLGAGFSSPPSVLFVLPSTASAFVPVSITGQNFGPLPTVTFNGVPAVGIVSLSTKTLPLDRAGERARRARPARRDDGPHDRLRPGPAVERLQLHRAVSRTRKADNAGTQSAQSFAEKRSFLAPLRVSANLCASALIFVARTETSVVRH